MKNSEWIVTKQSELLPFLLEHMADKGRNKVKALLARGQVSVNGKEQTLYNFPLQQGHKVTVNWSLKHKQEPLQGLKIIYEDEELLVIDKEAGLLSIASDQEKTATAYYILTDYVRRANARNRIFIVHRLDRDTSGVMLFAKNEQTKLALQNAWNDTVQERKYIALVEGAVRKNEGPIISWLKESKTLKMYSSPVPNGGDKAVTRYQPLRISNDFSLLEVELETGRKNQIRVHLQQIGHPITGDKKYGAKQNPLKRLALHAWTIAFIHPATGELIKFEAPIPEHFFSVF